MRKVIRGNFCAVTGLLPAEYTKTDRVQVLERRQVSGDKIEPKSLSVLQIQEVPSRRHVQRLYVYAPF